VRLRLDVFDLATVAIAIKADDDMGKSRGREGVEELSLIGGTKLGCEPTIGGCVASYESGSAAAPTAVGVFGSVVEEISREQERAAVSPAKMAPRSRVTKMKSLKWPAWRAASWRLSVKARIFRVPGAMANSGSFIQRKMEAMMTVVAELRPSALRAARRLMSRRPPAPVEPSGRTATSSAFVLR
jgi:hypothetical protein